MMSPAQNLLIILTLAILAGYCLYLGKTDTAATCIGALAGALTIGRGDRHETLIANNGPADHNGV